MCREPSGVMGQSWGVSCAEGAGGKEQQLGGGAARGLGKL